MKYLKLFESFALNETDLYKLLPTKDDLIDLVDEVLLDYKFRETCQNHAYPQLLADKILTENFNISHDPKIKKIALLSNVGSKYSFDKSKEGIEELQNKLGRDVNIENIMSDLIEMEAQGEIDRNEKHVISSDLDMDILLIEESVRNVVYLKIKIEGKFVVKFDDFAAYTCPIEKELNLLEQDEPSKQDVVDLIKEFLTEIKLTTIKELDELHK
jgi:hypothetical protein